MSAPVLWAGASLFESPWGFVNQGHGILESMSRYQGGKEVKDAA